VFADLPAKVWATSAIWSARTGAALPSYRELKMRGLPARTLPNGPLAALLLFVLAAGAGACRDIKAPAVQDVGGIDDETIRLVVGNSSCPNDVLGAATVMGSTTGGGTAASVTVTTLADLIAYAKRTQPTIVRVKGMIAVPPAARPFRILVGSNKTIVGVDARSGLIGGGLLVQGAENVIVRNLVIALPVGTDAIAVSAATHVWIDHCELYSDTEHDTDHYGRLVDISSGSNFITLSWNWFHDHFNTIQVGDSDRNGRTDADRLTLTIHHNLFQRTILAAPRVRSGMVHVFNNYYQDVAGYAIASLSHSQVAIEENVFENVKSALTTGDTTSVPRIVGQIEALGNSCDPPCVISGANPQRRAFAFMPSNSYSYLADATSAVPVLVGSCAGPGTSQSSTRPRSSQRLASENAVQLSGRLQP
jgi:pectate lyase